MADPRSLSVKEISAATQKAVASVVDQQRGRFLKPPYIFGFFPPWWCGFVIREADLDKLTFHEAQKIAADVHKGIAGSVAAAKDGKPGALLQGGITTIGFAPPIDILLKE
jgi:hypothetical protein